MTTQIRQVHIDPGKSADLQTVEVKTKFNAHALMQGDPTDTNEDKEKHFSNAQGKKWEDHADLESNTHHGFDHDATYEPKNANIQGHIAATAAHGTTGNIVGTSDAQTITNKKYGGDTNYIEIDANGTIISHGTAHTPYGSMKADNITETVVVSAVDTYYEIGGSLSDGGSNGFTFQNAKELKCLIAGKYKVDYSIAVYTASANQEIESEVMINSTAQDNTSNHMNSMTANRPVSMSGTGILALAVNDVVKISLSNHTSTEDIVVQHANLTLVMVGG
jgi:hypothetical protein